MLCSIILELMYWIKKQILNFNCCLSSKYNSRGEYLRDTFELYKHGKNTILLFLIDKQ